MKRQRIFVAGEHGQVARALARCYAARGNTFACAGRSTLDIADRAAVARAVAEFRPDLVVNTAAYTDVDRAEDESDLAFRVNCNGAGNLAAAARTAKAPIIHVSTDYVFDGTKQQAYVEADATNPLGAYGRSKLAGEQAVAAEAPAHVILRTSWVYSPDGSNFVLTMLRLARERDEIAVVDDQWGAPTSAADLAGTIATIGDVVLAASDRPRLYGIYHAAGTGETSRCCFARAVMTGSAAQGGPACRIRAITMDEYPTRAKRPANSRLDCSKLANIFGLKLPHWAASLDICIARLRAQGAI
jgi:dTDP-4-dehydrorhamnose reductase